MARAEAKRDAAHHDASMTRMDADVAGSVRAKVESKLSRVLNALAVVEEARQSMGVYGQSLPVFYPRLGSEL